MSSQTSSPSRKKKKKVMFLLPGEEPPKNRDLRSSMKQHDETFSRTNEQPQNFRDENELTQSNVNYFNDEIAEKEMYSRKSSSQNQNRNFEKQQFEQNSVTSDSLITDSQHSLPKFSPVKRKDPNKKFVPTSNFVTGEGTSDKDTNELTHLIIKTTKEKDYQRELLDQIEEKKKYKEDEKRRLKEQELQEEERVKRELQELQREQHKEKEDEAIKIRDEPQPIQVQIPPGAKYAQYKNTDEGYNYNEDYNKFDILDRARRASITGVPKSKLIADIGHDLKLSIKNEIDRVRGSVKEQQRDLQDQLQKMHFETKVAIEERDKVQNHLKQLKNELKKKREDQISTENELMKTLNKYKLEPERLHYPQKPFHLEYKYQKPEEKKSVYEKIFFDKIQNKIEAEKLNPPLHILREATLNPKAQITIGHNHYFANSQGQLNSESTLVTLDHKQLYPSKSLYELPDLQSKTTIVNWHREPYEYYNNKVKDINPRNDVYIVKNNYENKYAHRIDDQLNFKRFNLLEREEHLPHYDQIVRPIDLANINVEKLQQINEQRLTRLDREYKTSASIGMKRYASLSSLI